VISTLFIGAFIAGALWFLELSHLYFHVWSPVWELEPS